MSCEPSCSWDLPRSKRWTDRQTKSIIYRIVSQHWYKKNISCSSFFNNKNSSDLKHHQLACFVKWDVCTELTPTPASVCSPCCRLTNDTDASTPLPPDYRAASFDRLWDSWTQPQHSTNKLCSWLSYPFFISLYSLRRFCACACSLVNCKISVIIQSCFA